LGRPVSIPLWSLILLCLFGVSQTGLLIWPRPKAKADSSIDVQQVAAVSQEQPRSERRPNFRVQSYYQARVEEAIGDGGAMEGLYMPDDQSLPNALVVCIKNKADDNGDGVYAENVRASLTFLDQLGEEIGHINQACWIGGVFANATFEAESRHCLVILGRGEKENAIAVPYIKEQNAGYGNALSVEGLQLKEEPHSVEVVLVWRNKRVLAATFDFLENEPFLGLRV
jgi:hypothetical protein